MRVGRLVIGGLLAAAIGTGIAVAPATAADGWQRTDDVVDSTYDNDRAKTCATSAYGTACFQRYGEWIWLRDTYTDGEPVAMRWSYFGADGSSRFGKAYWDGGSDDGWTNLNKSFEENGSFHFQVCEVDLESGNIIGSTCSTWAETWT